MTEWHPYSPLFAKPTLVRYISAIDESLAKRPNDPDVHHGLGCWLYGRGGFGWAEKNLRFALQLDSSHVLANLSLGLMRATCPDESYRNGAEAVILTMKSYELVGATDLASSEWVIRRHLQAEAAAHAENLAWDLAVAKQSSAIACTTTQSQRPQLNERLQRYLGKKPLRLSNLSL